MKHIFIINPNSGRNKKMDIENKIINQCKNMQMEYDIYHTTLPGDAKRVAEELKDKEQAVIYAVGGDGTVNEVVNGIIGSSHMLSVIPTGSGNDFYKTLKRYNKEFFSCDVGKINDMYFINIACIGIDAEIANNVYLMRKNPLIPVSQRYNASIIYTFFKYKFKNLELKFGELSKKGTFTITTVCNAGYYGGGYRIAPHALIDDGQFEIYAVEKMHKLSIPQLLLKVKNGNHEKDSRVHRYRDNRLEIICDKEVSCNVDGEILKADRFQIEIIRNGITLYPNNSFVKALGIM